MALPQLSVEGMGRRELLKRAAALGIAAQAAPLSAWCDEPKDGKPLKIECYPDRTSYVVGEQISFHVSTTGKTYSIELARVGVKREVVFSKTDIAGTEHPVPPGASLNGCNWPAAVTLPVDAAWRSGYYSIDLKASDGAGKTAVAESFLILRSSKPGRDTKILFQLSTNTYQAYNDWGGHSLYTSNEKPVLEGHRVSFQRPLKIYPTPLRPGTDWYNPNTDCAHQWDLPFIRWAEQAGYTLDYAANADLELHPELLKHYRLVLSVGHDEYWSGPMRDNLETYIGNGGNVAFFSGNTCCWQVRFEDAGKSMVSWKQAYKADPVFTSGDHRTLTALWSNPLLKRPENQLTGVGFMYGGYNGLFGEFMTGPGAGEYTIHRADHWLLKGTDLKRGGTFGATHGIVGYECDGCEYDMVDGLPVPTGIDGTPKNLEIVAIGPARLSDRDRSLSWSKEIRAELHKDKPAEKIAEYQNRLGSAILGAYTRGGTVVTAGTTDWSHGLAGGDKTVDRITRNVLDKLSV